MTQMDVNSRVATILSKTQSDLRAVVLDAAKAVAADAADPDGTIVLELIEDVLKAEVNINSGSITAHGSVVDEVEGLLSILDALVKLPGLSGAPPQVPTPPVKPVIPVSPSTVSPSDEDHL